MSNKIKNIDGNEAVALIAYKTSEICAIYPITPSSTMGEFVDLWSTNGHTNIWGSVPLIKEMQSEAGVSGALHGALQTGSLATTFTSSQGLLLMIPNMYKIAGELTPTVIHVASRAIAAQGLSIFGDHQDVMSVRPTGFAILASSSVQEAHDMALIAHASSLESRIPFIHFFDGFRTSHEINKINILSDEEIKKVINEDHIIEHRKRALDPENPFIRGTSQNPDVYFQGREAVNKFYNALPDIVLSNMQKLNNITGRNYNLFNYYGHEAAEKIIVIMGSGANTVRKTIDSLNREGEKLGVIQVNLYAPFASKYFLSSLPKTTKLIAVLDRTKEPGTTGEPLYHDVVTTITEAVMEGKLHPIKIIGGRYGLSSKEFTPAMVKSIYDELNKAKPKNHFTIGINDDVTNTSLSYSKDFKLESKKIFRAMFFGLGSDGTVGANKNTIKIIGEGTDFYTQGYFVYDSKKSGSRTISHLRFGPDPIYSSYLIQSANFIGCHQFNFLEQIDVLKTAANEATFLLNTPIPHDKIWNHLPNKVQKQIIDKNIKFYVIDAYKIAQNVGLGHRINTIMQTCFFAISEVLPKNDAIAKIKESIEKTYHSKGEAIVKKNFDAIDQAIEHLHKVQTPSTVTSNIDISTTIACNAPKFVKNVTKKMISDLGDDLPVSALPADGTYPSGTTKFEKRNISDNVPIWDPETCIQCGACGIICPHGVIRSKYYNEEKINNAPDTFKHANLKGKYAKGKKFTLQVYIEDCTGCTLCEDICPVKNKETDKKAIYISEKAPILEQEKENIKFFETISFNSREELNTSNSRGVQFLEPLFEFSGACAGCGETAYIKLVTQLFGDRMLVANATGCSSIYGGNLPTTPWSINQEGRGPAWSNSLFEDNAEFGFGYYLTSEKLSVYAKELLTKIKHQINDNDLINKTLDAVQKTEAEILQQRHRIAEIKAKLSAIDTYETKHLNAILDHLIRKSIWIIGGDGWAYDIGFGGLDHVIASGKNINILVLDTEVYSNTGGQASKATSRSAVAKFAIAGKKTAKKDLGVIGISYRNVYVAQIAIGANQMQTIKAIKEAEAYDGPSLILAYSPCIAHGINMHKTSERQKAAVNSGYWPLFRYNPNLTKPMILDSKEPSISFEEYAIAENRYKLLTKTNPKNRDKLIELAQEDINKKWEFYKYLSEKS